jgi:hypothetical protein
MHIEKDNETKFVKWYIEAIIPKLDIDKFILTFESDSEIKNEDDKNISINKTENEISEI